MPPFKSIYNLLRFARLLSNITSFFASIKKLAAYNSVNEFVLPSTNFTRANSIFFFSLSSFQAAFLFFSLQVEAECLREDATS